VLDPFGGSGTTGMVADGMGHDAILIELNEAYAEIARKRIADVFRPVWIERKSAPSQPDMFDETADAIGSYADAVKAIGERVAAGEPVPDFFLSERKP
jgi:hypothetical protein